MARDPAVLGMTKAGALIGPGLQVGVLQRRHAWQRELAVQGAQTSSGSEMTDQLPTAALTLSGVPVAGTAVAAAAFSAGADDRHQPVADVLPTQRKQHHHERHAGNQQVAAVEVGQGLEWHIHSGAPFSELASKPPGGTGRQGMPNGRVPKSGPG